jgi:hypothetical protein
MTKVCRKCGEAKDADTFFYRGRNVCKRCWAVKNKKWCQDNPGKMKQYNRNWKNKNREKVIQANRNWENKNREKVKQKCREFCMKSVSELRDSYINQILNLQNIIISDETRELKRQQLIMKRTLKEFKKWMKEHESDYENVYGKQQPNEENFEGRV